MYVTNSGYDYLHKHHIMQHVQVVNIKILLLSEEPKLGEDWIYHKLKDGNEHQNENGI